jgi:hypothetical protein
MDTQPQTRVTVSSPSSPDARLVRASGLCAWCDSRFINEIVWRIPDSAIPGGVLYIESRHFDAMRT